MPIPRLRHSIRRSNDLFHTVTYAPIAKSCCYPMTVMRGIEGQKIQRAAPVESRRWRFVPDLVVVLGRWPRLVLHGPLALNLSAQVPADYRGRVRRLFVIHI